MTETVIKKFTSQLSQDMYTIDSSTRIPEYASVMAILRRFRGSNYYWIINELKTSFPNFKIDSLDSVLKELAETGKIVKEKEIYKLTAHGMEDLDFIGACSETAAKKEELLNPESQRFWKSIRSYREQNSKPV